MSAKSSRGLEIWMTKDNLTKAEITITGITKATPSVISAINTLAKDDLIFFPSGSGFSELDGHLYPVSSTSGTVLTLVGSDLITSTGTMTPGYKATVFKQADMQKLCLSSLDISSDAPSTISVATYCDPSATVPSAVTEAGTLSFSGFVDAGSKDYQELVKAELDQVTRYFKVMLPGSTTAQGQGDIVFPAIISSLTWSLPLDGAIGYEGSATLATKAVHRF
jgi:hypothetical protein